jgi:hypothetical protein
MSTNPNHPNSNHEPLPKTQIDTLEEAYIKKTEAEKAQKSKDKPTSSPWAPGVWEAARQARRNGTPYTKRLHPVIISSSGLFPSAREVKEMLGLPSTPEVGWGVKATWSQREEPGEAEVREEDRLRYCEVDRGQLHRIEKCSEGEDVLVWVRGKRRMGWLAMSKKEGGDMTAGA